MRLARVKGSFCVEVIGVDLSRSDSERHEDFIRDALYEHSLLLFRDQHLPPHRIVAWSQKFGDLELHSEAPYLLEGHPEIVVIGNLMEGGRMKSLFVNAREEWHFDYAYAAIPSVGALFYAVEIPPEGGDTLFADMRAAYDALDDDTKLRIEPLVAVFSYEEMDRHLRSMDPTRPPLSESAKLHWPPVKHHLVQTHPVTKRNALRLAPEVMGEVIGMDKTEAQRIISNLLNHATRDRFVYRHQWKSGDLVIFDNRSLIHSATPFDANRYRRVMYRTTIMK